MYSSVFHKIQIFFKFQKNKIFFRKFKFFKFFEISWFLDAKISWLLDAKIFIEKKFFSEIFRIKKKIRTDKKHCLSLWNYQNSKNDEFQDYIIGTPESYHSTPPASPAPLLAEEHLPPPQQFGSHPEAEAQQNHVEPQQQQHFEENDAAPPLLEAEVANLTVSEPVNSGQGANPILAPNLVEGDGYSTGEDEAPPRLSPIFGKCETHEEEEVKEADPQLMAPGPAPAPAPAHNGMAAAYDPMAAGPSMHMTPQMMTPQNRHPSTSTPQQHQYSHPGPSSHQNTTPGSGGVPSCGPVYNHSTPEQQAAQQQQFMSPMAGMPGSVQSVHSVHNNNSMEMVGGPASLQHTPQYDMAAHSMGQVSNRL